jgi:excisionase family DNA binding protein
MDETPIFLTIPQAADLLAIGDTLAYELAAAGVLPVVRLRGAVRVHRAALLRWAEDQATTAPAREEPKPPREPPARRAPSRTANKRRDRRPSPRRVSVGMPALPDGAELLAG